MAGIEEILGIGHRRNPSLAPNHVGFTPARLPNCPGTETRRVVRQCGREPRGVQLERTGKAVMPSHPGTKRRDRMQEVRGGRERMWEYFYLALSWCCWSPASRWWRP